MTRLRVSLGCPHYDRVAAILDGRVQIDGCEIISIKPQRSGEIFHRALKFEEFDIAELSLGSHAALTARGASPYIAVPVFLSRVFRHSGIYVRTDRGIDSPQDLKGRLIGAPEFQQTANVWIRGLLQDEYGVKTTDVKWRTGGLFEPGRTERTELNLPPDIDLRPIPPDRTLTDMFEKGELDAIFAPREPTSLKTGRAPVARLFPDYRGVEEAYFRKTRIFPIMHVLAIRRELAAQHPWLPVEVYRAFDEAKRIAVKELAHIGALSVTLPWSVSELQRTIEIMGPDYWPYGLDANRAQLEVFARYMQEQGLTAGRLKIEDLFAPSTLDIARG
jgi:4,5-dihydroxyphthalate decarboxylase